MSNHSQGRKEGKTAVVSVVKAAIELLPQLSSPHRYTVEFHEHLCNRKGTEEDKNEWIAIPAYTDVKKPDLINKSFYNNQYEIYK